MEWRWFIGSLLVAEILGGFLHDVWLFLEERKCLPSETYIFLFTLHYFGFTLIIKFCLLNGLMMYSLIKDARSSNCICIYLRSILNLVQHTSMSGYQSTKIIWSDLLSVDYFLQAHYGKGFVGIISWPRSHVPLGFPLALLRALYPYYRASKIWAREKKSFYLLHQHSVTFNSYSNLVKFLQF